MNDQFPDNPTGPVVNDSSAPTEIVPPAEEAAAAKTLQQQLQDVAVIGKDVRNIGILDFSRGMAISNQTEIAKMMQELRQLISKLINKKRKTSKDYTVIAKITDSLGRLSFQLTQSQTVLLEAEKSSPAGKPDEPEPLRKTLGPGEKSSPGGLTDSLPASEATSWPEGRFATRVNAQQGG